MNPFSGELRQFWRPFLGVWSCLGTLFQKTAEKCELSAISCLSNFFGVPLLLQGVCPVRKSMFQFSPGIWARVCFRNFSDVAYLSALEGHHHGKQNPKRPLWWVVVSVCDEPVVTISFVHVTDS
jgi:hypothetical protein